MVNKVQLFNEDCFQRFKQLEDNSVDCIITDPPYFIDYAKNDDRFEENSNWDSSKINVKDWYKKFLLECKRVIKEDGSIWVCAGPSHVIELILAGEELGLVDHKENWCCLARAKGRGSKSKLKSLREDIVHFTKRDNGYKWHSAEYLREVVVPYTVNGVPRGWALDQSTGERVRFTGCGNVMFFTMPSYNKKFDKQWHPCQKPFLMWVELIMLSSNKGDLLFDPFAGSASSGVAAEICDRNWIGCELDSEIYKKAKEWLDDIDYEEAQNYVKKRVSSSEKNFKFGFDSREILQKKCEK